MEFPSRIVSCIPRPTSSIIAGGDKTETTTTFDLIIQCCGAPTGRESFLFTEWTFEKEFYVSSEAIVGLCFVLGSPDIDSNVLVVADRETWASMFYESASVDYTD